MVGYKYRYLKERRERLKNKIEMFFHCKQCMKELDNLEMTPREYADLEAGWTKKGFQVWCKRHELNIIHVDFMGQKVGIAHEQN
jgi:hypothetical protein